MTGPSIFVITGPPAAGKTHLAAALASRFDRAIHIPIDDLRHWVVQGLADSVPWTEETERQFRIAEIAACGIARCYHDAGFTVLLDHCRNLTRLDELATKELEGRPISKICLLPSLDVNLLRNETRTNKDFKPSFLHDVIIYLNQEFRSMSTGGWHVIDNTTLSIDETADLVLGSREP